MSRYPSSLPVNQLTLCLTQQDLPFDKLSEIEPVSGYFGHQRATEALQFGTALDARGYNLFVTGEPGTGRFSLSQQFLQQLAASRPAADDWLYLANFEQQREPLYLRLSAGAGQQLLQHIDQFIDQLLATFPAVFENPGYQRKRARIEREFNLRYERAMDVVERLSSERGIAMLRDETSVVFTPLIDGKTLDEADFSALSDEQKAWYQEQISALEELMSEQLLELPQWRREAAELQHQLDLDTIQLALKPLCKNLERLYPSDIGVLRYIRAMKHHLPRVIREQLLESAGLEHPDQASSRNLLTELYRPNLLISHDPDQGAPVVYEPCPGYGNLFGRIEYQVTQGAYVTNHSLIRPGALHRANGGYLLLDAEKLLQEPQVWHHLKLALKTAQITMNLLPDESGSGGGITLRPHPVPLQVKIVIVGERQTYYLLQQLDPEFNTQFRILADCDSDIPRTPDSLLYLSRVLRAHTEQSAIPDVTAEATLELIRYSSRLAEDKNRLSTRISALFQRLDEANIFRLQEGLEQITRQHIQQASQASHYRQGRLREQLLDDLDQGLLLIETQGTATGRVNGLTVLNAGQSAFGIPARISATAYPGSDGIVDIEREVELGQPIHSKGVMILTGFLGHRYARQIPLSLSANIALEQSYGYVDGDSASLAEICALLSALIEHPMRQDLAVTGSINQYGEVQAIGGVNQKIEGFFALCQRRGLTGQQGVLIPEANIRNLVLPPDVVNAVAEKQFAVYAIGHVDQALALLAGHEAGQWQKGAFTAGSLNARIVSRLEQIALQVGHKPGQRPAH